MSRRADQFRRQRVFKVKPYDQPRQEQTPAQVAATRRNFKVFNLRGLHALCYHLTGVRRTIAHMLIDAELARLGADGMEAHAAKQVAERDARWAAQDAANAMAQQLHLERVQTLLGFGLTRDEAGAAAHKIAHLNGAIQVRQPDRPGVVSAEITLAMFPEIDDDELPF